MRTRYLFPHRFKKFGWAILLPSLLLALLLIMGVLEFPWLDMKVFALYNRQFLGENQPVSGFIENNIADELIAILLIIGALLVACSEVKEEDEFIRELRLESLLWAMYVNAGLLLFCLVFVYGMGFYQVMVFNLFTLLLLFLIRFHLVLYRSSRIASYEE